ncbi:MAG: hypothetical protein U0T83_00085 [Bacteriovoracaceae bacterium]
MKNNKGQSTIEFIMTFAFTFGILFLFVKLAINSTTGYLVHYATFLSSRTYLVWENNGSTPNHSAAEQQARMVFRKIVKQSPENLQFNSPEKVSPGFPYEYVGAYYSFSQGITVIPMVGGSQKANLYTESYLGREPTRATCMLRIVELMKTMPGTNLKFATFFDDGC